MKKTFILYPKENENKWIASYPPFFISLTSLFLFTSLLFLTPTVVAQDTTTGQALPRKITGVITDEKGETIIGATVLIKGTIKGALSDNDGNYSIEAKEGDILEFRYIGYNYLEKEVKSGSVINVVLSENSVSLDEVAIIGYGQQKKESVVASINTVTAKEISLPQRNLRNNIAGQLAGIIAIQRSGEPGNDGAQFWIRGQSSYAGGTSPLVLVDGVPRSMDDIDVDEIETFSVLKDAAATAVYGSEGANGVVLITSKRGKMQKTRIDFNAQYSLLTPTRMPELLPAYDYLSLYNEAQWNEAGNPDWENFNRTYSDEVLDKYRNGTDPDLNPNTNWMDLLTDQTQSRRYTISFRGGSDKVRYFVSGAYYSEDGIFKSNPIDKYDANIGLDRYNLRSNIDMDLSSTTKMSVDISGQYLRKNNPGSSSDAIFKMITQFPTHYIPMQYSDGSASDHETYDPGERANPYNMLNSTGYTKQWNMNAQSKVTLDQQLNFITKGLSWKGTLSFDASSYSRIKREKTANTFFATARDTDGNLVKKEIKTGTALGNPAYDDSGGDKKIYVETSLNYKRTFNEKHDVTGLLLYMQKERQRQNVPGLEMLPYRKQSAVARAVYGYDIRYMIEASFGATGSENFAAGHRWGIFPAIGAAWFASHEEFMRPVEDYLSKLKIRASFGVTGNDEIGSSNRFPYRESLSTSGTGYNMGLNPGTNGDASSGSGSAIIEDNFGTPNLTWEKEQKSNIGLDLGFFRGKVDLVLDGFYNRRDNILLRRQTIATAAGFRNAPWQNFGVTSNKGLEASLILQQQIEKVNLSARGNFTYAKNKIIEYDEVPQVYDYQVYTGNSINQPFVWIAEGLYTPDDFDIIENPDGSKIYTLKSDLPNPGTQVASGDIKYKDLNGDKKIDSLDKTYYNGLFPKDPQLVYGFGLNAEWNGIFMGIFFQGVANTSVNLLNAANFMPFNNGVDASSARMEALDRWTDSNPYNQNVLYPRMHSTKFDHNTQESTWWYRSGNFIRLKNLEVGYQFNKNLLKKIKMQNLRVYLQGTNLTVWDNVKYWDPELGNANSGSTYPICATWTMGLEVSF
jgi:TonB-linked SusC/RagA family outer membrane protein